ncbi:MAG: hypothetical protein Q8Q28_13725 [Pseudomonadota bacterium]|nr:hypothetical protein [Pseudomonadota bacterium]
MQNANINSLAAVTENLKKIEPDFEELLRAAEGGDAESQFKIGGFYLQSADEDDVIYGECARWFTLASDQGDADAQYFLALIYLYGWGVEKDIEKSKKLLRSAATQGLPHAQNTLGELYEDGGSKMEAASWYAKAAEQRDADAQYNLGRLIRLGVPVPKTSCLDEADQWLREAGVDIEQYRDVTEDPSEAIKWLSAATKQGHVDALYLLAEMHELGEGCAKDIKEARELYQLAANQGHTDAMLKLSGFYKHGRGVDTDTEKSKALLLKAAEDSSWSKDQLIEYAQRWFYDHKISGFGDLSHPIRISNKMDSAIDASVAQNLPVALVLRGMICFAPERKDYMAARNWFARAEKTGDVLAAFYLALMSLRGLGVRVNLQLASKYLDKCISSLSHYDDLYQTNRINGARAAEQQDNNHYHETFEITLLGAARSQQLDIKIALAQEETHKQTLSFLTHTLNNALSTGPETVRTVIEILGSDLYNQGQAEYKAINNMASLFPVFLFAESLLKTFKLYVSDPEQMREKWQNDKSGDANVSLVIAMALRQSIARFVFSSNHLAQLKRLLPKQDKEAIKEVRKSFVDEIIPLEMSTATAGKVFEWAKAHFSILQVEIDPEAEMTFTSNATRYMFYFAAFSELVYNALKYADGQQPIVVKWFQQEGDYRFSCTNSCPLTQEGLPTQEGSNKGLSFIHKLMSMLENSALERACENGEYRALLTFDHANFDEVVS